MLNKLKTQAEAEGRDIRDEELSQIIGTEVLEQFKRKFASLGGLARKKALSAKRRSEIAKLAVEARWKKKAKRRKKN